MRKRPLAIIVTFLLLVFFGSPAFSKEYRRGCNAEIYIDSPFGTATVIDFSSSSKSTSPNRARSSSGLNALLCATTTWSQRWSLLGSTFPGDLSVFCSPSRVSGLFTFEVDIKSRIAQEACPLVGPFFNLGSSWPVSVEFVVSGNKGCGSGNKKSYHETLSASYNITPEMCRRGY